MGKALYRKYRSKNLSEVVGQEHITTALSRAIEKGHVSHAYLFTGPRGVGKTSVARILAYEVNKLPYDETGLHLDIIEIDAASNRRIDEVRDLREKVHIAPTSAKYKVYIIDEVHMLTREAFNALLKTLEEPPSHVLFVLATTEVHKLPETIISRTQHFAFKPIEESKVVKHLEYIAKEENITIDKKALKLIAEHGGGSFRDSISILDQVKNYADKIGITEVEMLLGVAPAESVESIFTALSAHDPAQVIKTLQNLKEQGVDAAVLSNQLSLRLQKELLLDKPSVEPTIVLQVLTDLISIPASAKPLLALEIALLKVIFEARQPQIIAPLKVTLPEPQEKKTPTALVTPKQALSVTATTPPAKTPNKPEKTATEADDTKPVSAPTGTFDIASWPQVLLHIKKSHNTMYGVLRMAEPAYTKGTLTLRFNFAFHQKRVNDRKNKTIIAEAIGAVTGASIAIDCIVREAEHTNNQEAQVQPIDSPAVPLSTISNIFGGGELLES
jgi:DNA polymerase III subunit gamma/tau